MPAQRPHTVPNDNLYRFTILSGSGFEPGMGISCSFAKADWHSMWFFSENNDCPARREPPATRPSDAINPARGAVRGSVRATLGAMYDRTGIAHIRETGCTRKVRLIIGEGATRRRKNGLTDMVDGKHGPNRHTQGLGRGHVVPERSCTDSDARFPMAAYVRSAGNQSCLYALLYGHNLACI